MYVYYIHIYTNYINIVSMLLDTYYESNNMQCLVILSFRNLADLYEIPKEYLHFAFKKMQW